MSVISPKTSPPAQYRQRLFSHALEAAGDAHLTVHDDVELVAVLALGEDQGVWLEPFLLRVGREEPQLGGRHSLLAQDIHLGGLVEEHALARLAGSVAARAEARRDQLRHDVVGGAHFGRQGVPERPQQRDSEVAV